MSVFVDCAVADKWFGVLCAEDTICSPTNKEADTPKYIDQLIKGKGSIKVRITLK